MIKLKNYLSTIMFTNDRKKGKNYLKNTKKDSQICTPCFRKIDPIDAVRSWSGEKYWEIRSNNDVEARYRIHDFDMRIRNNGHNINFLAGSDRSNMFPIWRRMTGTGTSGARTTLRPAVPGRPGDSRRTRLRSGKNTCEYGIR